MTGILLDVIDAVDECKRHECHTIAISTCEKCPSFYGHYENLNGKAAIMCLFPDDAPRPPVEER